MHAYHAKSRLPDYHELHGSERAANNREDASKHVGEWRGRSETNPEFWPLLAPLDACGHTLHESKPSAPNYPPIPSNTPHSTGTVRTIRSHLEIQNSEVRCTHMQTQTRTRTFTHTHTHTRAHSHTQYTHAHTLTHTRIPARAHAHAHEHAHALAHTMRTYNAHMYIHTRAHAHAHAHCHAYQCTPHPSTCSSDQCVSKYQTCVGSRG